MLDQTRRELGSASVPIVVNQGNSSGKTAMHHAAWAGDLEVMRLLINANASVDALSVRGHAPLHQACSRPELASAATSLLLDCGASPAVRNVRGDTPCSLAAQHGFPSSVLDRMRQAEATASWVDFHKTKLSRETRRALMCDSGTIMFSSDDQQRKILACGDAVVDTAPLENCCALIICLCPRSQKGRPTGDKKVKERTEGRRSKSSAPSLSPEATYAAGLEAWRRRYNAADSWSLEQWADELDLYVAAVFPDRGENAPSTEMRQCISAGVTVALANNTRPFEKNLVMMTQSIAANMQSTSKQRRCRGGLLRGSFLHVVAESLSARPPCSAERICEAVMAQPSTTAVGLLVDPRTNPQDVYLEGNTDGTQRARLVAWLLTEAVGEQDAHNCTHLALRVILAFSAQTTREWPAVSDLLTKTAADSGDFGILKAIRTHGGQLVDGATLVQSAMDAGGKARRPLSWVRKLQWLALAWGVPAPLPSPEHSKDLELTMLQTLLGGRLRSVAPEYADGIPYLECLLVSADVSGTVGPSARNPCRGGGASVLQATYTVEWVDSLDGLDRMGTALRGASIVGLDAEWREPWPCSTIQLALLPQRVTWVVCTLHSRNGPDYFQRLGKVLAAVLSADHITKIGFAFAQDYLRIQTICPALVQVTPAQDTLIDFHDDLDTAMGTSREDPHAQLRQRIRPLARRSLCVLASAVFDAELSKGPQISNWDRRPLRDDQLRYAALDAEVLIRLYQAFHGEVPDIQPL